MWRSGQRSAQPSETSWFASWHMWIWVWSRRLQSFSLSSAKRAVRVSDLITGLQKIREQEHWNLVYLCCYLLVDNLLKYTGYGNAAGLLVARGLLAGGRGDTQYSEDEDSDTEEYKSAKPLWVFSRWSTNNLMLPCFTYLLCLYW